MAHILPRMSTGAQLINTLRNSSGAKNTEVCEFRHTALYDQGCEELFRWLTSGDEVNPPEARFPKSFTSLSLSDVHMGDAGFQALITWLESLKLLHGVGHETPLTTLNLRFNEIVGSAELAQAFVFSISFPSPISSLPSSSLSRLVLSNNPLSASFKTTLFSLLPTLPSLRHLGLTMTGLTKDDALALALYIGNETHPCKLTELHANANHMGYSGVRAIITAIQRCWTMEKVEMYSNHVEDPVIGEEDDESTEGTDGEDELISAHEAILGYAGSGGCGWGRLQQSLKLVLGRNIYLKQNTTKEALLLLKYSRLMLQKKAKPALQLPTTTCDGCDCSPQPQQKTMANVSSEASPNSSFSFTYLPTEIQLHILSALAPTLSIAQRLRVFEYAVDPSTLPSLRLCLPSSSTGCVPDPGNLAFNSAAIGIRNRIGKKVGSLTKLREVHSCSGTTCMAGQSIVCQRQTTREKWLASVGCDGFDPGVH